MNESQRFPKLWFPLQQRCLDGVSPSGLSHPPREVKFACEASMVVQVKGAEHLPDAQHVALHNLLKGPGILVVLLHISLLLLHCH